MYKTEKLKAFGLIGCLNDTGVTSTNYKNKMNEDLQRAYDILVREEDALNTYEHSEDEQGFSLLFAISTALILVMEELGCTQEK